MTKTFNFTTNNSNKSIFPNTSNNYSKTIDNIILADIINKNNYLFEEKKSSGLKDLFDTLFTNPIKTGGCLKDNDDFIKATSFLANYKSTNNIPFIIGKMYTLSDGTPIIFYDDEIQIGFDTYKYSNFSNISFLNSLTPKTKKTIINIYIKGNANININL